MLGSVISLKPNGTFFYLCIMLLLKNLAKKISKLDQGEIFVEVFKKQDAQEFIIKLNTFDQIYEQSIQADGAAVVSTNSTPGFYSKTTEELNKGVTFTYLGLGHQKVFGDTYTLFESGEWFRSFHVVLKDGFFEITADPQKEDGNLFEKYGQDIYGLTDESIGKLAEFILPEVIKEIRKGIRA